jgi:glycosyltransferase involved in cell wall biosynthesis
VAERAAGGLRISLVALVYAPSVGGSQEHVRRIAEALAQAGHDVEVLTTDALRTPSAREGERIEPRVERLGGVLVRRHRTPAALRWLHRAARARWVRRPGVVGPPEAQRIGPWLSGPVSPALARSVWRAVRCRDVVIACSAPFATLALAPRLRSRRAAVVAMPLLHLRGEPLPTGIVRALLSSDRIVASTEHERSAILGLGVRATVDVIPPGTDLVGGAVAPPTARAALGLSEAQTIGYLGRLAAYKGIDTLLEAVPPLWADHPTLTVLVAGSPAGYDGVRTAIASGWGDGRLVLRESFAADDHARLLEACDVVVLPSRDESFGLVIAEAWAAGRPVVAGDIGVVRSMVRDGVDAVLVPVGDASALAAAVDSLLRDPARRRSLAEAGRARVEAELRWPVLLDRWVAVVEQVASDRAKVAV